MNSNDDNTKTMSTTAIVAISIFGALFLTIMIVGIVYGVRYNRGGAIYVGRPRRPLFFRPRRPGVRVVL
jgi:hypothetical protein